MEQKVGQEHVWRRSGGDYDVDVKSPFGGYIQRPFN